MPVGERSSGSEGTMQPGPHGYEPTSTLKGSTPLHGALQHQETPGDGRSPRQSASSTDASQSIG
eukprot:11012519-Prorocentrum_lima.AAC.1